MTAPQRPFGKHVGRSAPVSEQWTGVPVATSDGTCAARAARDSGSFVTREPGILERLGNRLHRLNESLKPYGLNL